MWVQHVCRFLCCCTMCRFMYLPIQGISISQRAASSCATILPTSPPPSAPGTAML